MGCREAKWDPGRPAPRGEVAGSWLSSEASWPSWSTFRVSLATSRDPLNSFFEKSRLTLSRLQRHLGQIAPFPSSWSFFWSSSASRVQPRRREGLERPPGASESVLKYENASFRPSVREAFAKRSTRRAQLSMIQCCGPAVDDTVLWPEGVRSSRDTIHELWTAQNPAATTRRSRIQQICSKWASNI